MFDSLFECHVQSNNHASYRYIICFLISWQGSEVEEVEQSFGDFASQVVRLYRNAAHAEVEWTVGPIPYKYVIFT